MSDQSAGDDLQLAMQLLFRLGLHRDADLDVATHLANEIRGGRKLSSVIEFMLGSDEFRHNNRVRLFVPPGHFYSPVVDPDQVRQHVAKIDRTVSSLPGIELDRDSLIATWDLLLPFLKDVPFQATKSDLWRYHFDNPAYSWGDGSVLHAMLRHYKPKRLIEIGSGWSSACAIDTIEIYLNRSCDVTFIEPYPDLLKEVVGKTRVRNEVISKPVQDVPVSVFEQLEAGDFLFIDSTHVAKTASDVCYELFEVLPRLAPGVIVHFHDIFWPFEYGPDWTLRENRSWNEIYLLRAFLYQNSAWKILFFNDYMQAIAPDRIAADYPQFARNSGGAFWMQRR